ncbi:MAG TPA: triose-phosphate isomerase [Acidimicrobiia bacterium]|nr:triose-phosphate isomerase [Acidimicrobiia bacterium]
MGRKDMIAGNWKMHATHLEAIQMVQKLGYRLEEADYQRVDVVVCPPFTALRSVQTVIEADYLPIRLGAQNAHFEEKGAFTGEIAPGMLVKLGVRYVIVGHSERRHVFGEDDATVAKKLRAVLAAGMTPIFALGEKLDQREADATESVIGGQLDAGLGGLDAATVGGLVIAYEPVWAIGTGRTASDDQAAEAIGFLRERVRAGFGDEAADAVRILYGGSVNAGNIAGLMAKRDIDGALVGGASLDPDSFASIVRYWV